MDRGNRDAGSSRDVKSSKQSKKKTWTSGHFRDNAELAQRDWQKLESIFLAFQDPNSSKKLSNDNLQQYKEYLNNYLKSVSEPDYSYLSRLLDHAPADINDKTNIDASLNLFKQWSS